MQIKHWPFNQPEDLKNGPVAKILQDISRKDPQLWSIVNARLQEAEKETTSLARFERQGWAERLRYTDALYEFKFPPQRKKGVIRIYFCCDPNIRNCIWLLEAEHKTGRSNKEHKAILKCAEQKCREIKERRAK